jgi:preprotein translocase subunit SecG
MLSIFINLLLVIHVIVSLLIVLVVLMQRPKSEGLGAAFGGGMTDNLFGAQTTNVLQGFTRWLGGLFFALTLLLSVLYARQTSNESAVQRQLKSAPAPAAGTVTPSPAVPAPEASASGTPAPAATPGTSAPTAAPAPASTAPAALPEAARPQQTPAASPATKP